MARFAFGLTVIALMVVLVFGEFRVAEAVGDWLGYEWGPGGSLVGGCALPNIMLAHVLADRLFKALGLSRSGRMVEGRRPAVDPAASPTVEDVVEIRLGRAISNTLTVGALAIGLELESL